MPTIPYLYASIFPTSIKIEMNLFISLLLAFSQLVSTFSPQNQKQPTEDKVAELFSDEVPPFSNCPVSPYPTQIVQPDNTTITIVGRGNMVNNWTETVDGYSIVLNNGIYEYAQNQNGNLTPTGIKANDPANRAASEIAFVSSLQPSLKPALTPLKQSILSQVQNRNLQKTFPTTGNIRVLALLIDYPDLQSTFAKSSFDSLLYGANFRNGDGSFKYYYETSSDSQITVTVDVYGWYRAQNSYLYYGYDSGYARAADLVREAVDAAETGGVNFALYDNDNDNDVDGILSVHAGPGAEQGSRTQYIWSHRWVLNGGNLGSVTYDGKFINDYMTNPETRIAGLNQNLVGIGVFCHEFGHNLGLPDLYDTDATNGDSEGIGNWCLMAGGGWLGGEHRPGNFSAWCRVENNWVTPTNLTIGSSNGSYTMNPASTHRNEIYRVNTPLNNEYFLLENRQKIGLDLEIPGEGLAIWHINTSKTNSSGNRVNADENLKGVDLEEADGLNGLDNETNRGDNGDLYPGSSTNRTFNTTSNPNSRNYSNGSTGFELRNITETGTQISFDFGPAPVVTCNGGTTLTANSGNFDDGSGAGNNYTNNLNCSWLIQVSNGPVNLNFSAFNIDSNGDTLYVYDGNSNTDPLLAKLTGSVTPAVISSTGNDLFLEFTTNGSATALGWNAVYTSAGPPAASCTGTTNLTPAISGTFDDGSGVGSNYSDNLNCSWLIDATTSAAVLSITIDSLDIESANDSLIIYEGQNNSGTVIATITNNSQAAVFNLYSQFAFVEFKTNGSINSKGWQISWAGKNGCSGTDTLRAFTGIFSDGTLPTVNYNDRSNCQWLIQPAGAQLIQLDFNRFATESGFDFVEVYDGPTTASPRLARLSGNTIPSPILSTGGVMLVRFTSDFSLSDLGFEANYTAYSNHCVPLQTFTTGTGSFTDGSGTNSYDPNLSCGWLIQPNRAANITLSFSAFDTESANDLVNIYDGTDNTGTLLASYSGNSIPVNVVLNGTSVSMFVEFVTNGTVSGAGWSASYTSVIGATCSGTTTLTAASGTFNDGSNSSNYDNNLNCGWLIQPSGSPAAITLDFNNMNIQFGDFVRIYDGTNSSGTLLATRTGTFIGSTITAFSGAMFVQFVTNGTNTGPGWAVTYNSSSTFCVPQTTYTGNFANFTDGSPFAGNYSNNSDCEWLIQPALANVAVRLNFTRFATELNNDTVTVYDGATTAAPILGTFSGTTIPPVLVSSGGDMLIKFKTNGSVQATGWQAFYQTQAIPFCSGTTNLTAVTGSFDDGSAATQNYVDNSNCNWLIQPAGASKITLQFSRFNLGTGDAVNVYDGASAAAPLIGSYTGNTIPPLAVSSGGSLFVNFTANGFGNSSGWAANYNSTTGQCFSNLVLTNFRDTIEDGSGVANYDNNLNCTWLIQPPTATNISLNFVQFDLSNPGDSLKIYDGTSSSASLIAALSGSTIPGTVSSTGGNMFIEFITDGSTTANGWKGYYDINSTLSCVGTTTLTAPSGTVADGSGTANYDNNLNCGWLIQPTGNPAVISLNFNSVSTVNFNDRVTVYDGVNNGGTILGTVFGTNTGNTFSAFSGSMYLEFTTDGFNTGAGWDATYSSSNSFCVPNTTLTNNFGQIFDGSPFGQNYLDNTSCQWLIQPTTPNVFIQLNFFQFATESGNDIVNVYDGATTSDPLLGSFSGTSIPPITTSTGGSMLVTFNSNSSITSTGWRATYNAQPLPSCIGLTTLTAPSGTFDDGSGTANYDNNLNCSWLIQPPGVFSVDLSFIAFDTELNFDFLRVYDGVDNTGTLLGSYSGTNTPPNLSASSGSMFLEFNSDGGLTRPGWDVSYTSSSTAVLNAVEDTIFVNAALGSQNTFRLNSNTNWSINDNGTWLVTNPVNGTGNRNIVAIAIQPNIGPVRYAEVFITAGTLKDTVVVAQRSSGRFLVTSPDTLYYDAIPAGSQTATISSNVTWNLTTNDSWINIGTSTGSNNGSSLISVASNNSKLVRTGFIVASGNLGASNDTIWVVQDSLPPPPPSLAVIPKNLTLAQPSGSNSTFTVNSTVTWQTSTPASWLSIQNPAVMKDTNVVGVTATSLNTTGADRSSFVAVQDVGGTLFDTVFVTQSGAPLVLDANPDTVTLGQLANSSALANLNANLNWVATSSDPANFAVTPASGSTSSSLTVSSLTANLSASSRFGYIAIDGGNGTLQDTIFIVQDGLLPTLSVNPTIINLNQVINSSDSFDVFSNASWSVINSPAAWLGVDIGSTIITGDSDVVVTALSDNIDPNSRSTKVILRTNGSTNATDSVIVNQAGTNPILQANQDTVMMAAMMGSTANVTFLSNGSWTAIEGDPWFNNSATSGSGAGNLTLTANSANTTNAQRISFLALADVANSITDTVIVVQDTAQIGVQASPDTVFVNATAGASGMIALSSSVNWSALPDAGWISLNPSNGNGNQMITVTALTDNPSFLSRVGRIVIADINDPLTNDTVVILQYGTPIQLAVSPNLISLNSTSGSSDVLNVTSNTNWLITNPANWLNLSTNNGANNATVTVTANSDNLTGLNRTATLRFSTSGAPDVLITVTQIDGTTPQFTFSRDTVFVDFIQGSTGTFSVLANQANWSLRENTPWLLVNPMQGNSTVTVTVLAASRNAFGNERSAMLVGQAQGFVNDTVYIVQRASTALFQAAPDMISLGSDSANTTNFNISSNLISWTIEESESWMQVVPDSGGFTQRIEVIATETNKSGAIRNGTLTIVSPPQVPLIVNVTQDTVRTIGLTEIENSLGIRIYPNPATEKVMIEGEGMDQIDINGLRLFNSLGKEVNVNFIRRSALQIELDLSSQAKGIYYLNYRENDKGISRKLILLD